MKITCKNYIFYTLKELNIHFELEYKFLLDRKFRIDFAIPDKKIGIEYEGIFSNKSRHTTHKGYSNDLEKYNLCVLNGWRVLRYSAINYKQFYSDIKKILNL